MRPDFAAASVGLTLPNQHNNLSRLHDWLLNEVQIGQAETVIALTNYQQGRFGRLPTHVLVVTSQRVAFTHDAGMRSIPLRDLDLGRIGLKVGLASGELTIRLHSGEELSFRKGMSVSIQEVAAALQLFTSPGGPGPVTPRAPSGQHQGANSGPGVPLESPSTQTPTPSAQPNSAVFSGRSDDVIQFHEAVGGLQILAIRGGNDYSNFTVWALDANLSPQELLVNVVGRYEGAVLCGVEGELGGIQVSAEAPWSIQPLSPDDLPVLGEGCGGRGDAVVFMQDDFELSSSAKTLRIQTEGSESLTLWAYGCDASLLINTIGRYSGTVVVPVGTQLLALTCDGPWSMSS